ncbi:DUF4166 domain-containing protein [Methylovirgula sp. 4M-Z18]|uniref:DUF4166 domain-containing protein n=1 Tax=Methylovirgula sp. 4M-Z18 TaxID=2293567 RepID=UPI000E2ED090|nr:DUF4166 domain-containing protein [Methylovirgula sp. 4M-Z18]RFB81230.1 DUF4166 domain-containing protein [Methylovirgula sp. 4M-Z18]
MLSLENRTEKLHVSPELGDLRFRKLLRAEDWASLPLSVRRRFSKRLAGGMTNVYAGEITQVRFSSLGWCLAQALRLIGAPLPLSRDTGVASVVSVTEDTRTGGQNWTRLYARRNGFPQIIHSAKRFAGKTGLEEYIGYGIGMNLTVHVEAQSLVFRSAGYFLQLGGRCLPWPRWLAPGNVTIVHQPLDDCRFVFSLVLQHPKFGELIRQSGVFRDERQ